MNPEAKKEAEKILKDFYAMIEKPNEADFELLLAGILGIYQLTKDKKLEAEIEKMIEFANENNWGIQGHIDQYEKIKEGSLK